MTRAPSVLLIGLLAFASVPAVNYASAQSAKDKCSKSSVPLSACVDAPDARSRLNKSLDEDRARLDREREQRKQAEYKRIDEEYKAFSDKLSRQAEGHRNQRDQDAVSFPGMPLRTLQKLSR
jgi:hypothetical protein